MHQPDLVSLVLTITTQHQTVHPASKAIAQTEPEGNKTKPVITAEKVITLTNMREIQNLYWWERYKLHKIEIS